MYVNAKICRAYELFRDKRLFTLKNTLLYRALLKNYISISYILFVQYVRKK